jgi:hypothetical protein
MLDLKRNYSVSNVDFTKETVALNQLDVDNCLFTPELLATLLKCPVKCSKSQSQVIKNKEGIYLIAFRILNKEKRSLVYNYIYYNDMLYLTLLVYFLVRNYFITEDNHEWGKYLVILDNKFLNYDLVNKYFDLYTKDKLRHKY